MSDPRSVGSGRPFLAAPGGPTLIEGKLTTPVVGKLVIPAGTDYSSIPVPFYAITQNMPMPASGKCWKVNRVRGFVRGSSANNLGNVNARLVLIKLPQLGATTLPLEGLVYAGDPQPFGFFGSTWEPRTDCILLENVSYTLGIIVSPGFAANSFGADTSLYVVADLEEHDSSAYVS